MNTIEVKPAFRGHSHQAMFFVALGACLLLIAKGSSYKEVLATIVYTLGTLSMFGISALYHRVTWQPRARALMKKLDHSAIFIMIAGSCTPVTIFALNEESGMKLLISVWIVALLGILHTLFFSNVPNLIKVIIYFIPGYMVAPYVGELIPKLGVTNMIYLFAGGAFYTFGAICYGIKKPSLNPKLFGYHEVFHLCVCVGAILHFIMIYSLIH